MIRRHLKPVGISLIICILLSSFAMSGAEAYSAASAVRIKKPLYIAHRGLSAKAPENTLPAFRRAAKNKGYYGVEFDVWESNTEPSTRTVTETVIDEEGNEQVLTREVANDPLLLVMHDSTPKRMCGVKADIRSINRETINNYTIRSGRNISKYKGQKIPTSDQAIDTIYRNSKGAIPVIELKHRLSPRALEYLLDSLDGRKAMIISFDFNAVSDAVKMAQQKGISRNIQTMYLLKKLPQKKYAATARNLKAAGIDCISLKYTAVSKKTVKKFHKSGLKVCVWTVPTRKTARKYARMGVDYITSNDALF